MNKKKSKGWKDKTSEPGQRSAMADVKNCNYQLDMMMLDCGTSSHMNPKSERVSVKKVCIVSILFVVDFAVSATEKDTRSAHSKTEDGSMQVNPSEILIASNVAINLLSIPALIKNISVLFMPEKVFPINLERKFTAVDCAHHNQDRLFYISNNQDSIPVHRSAHTDKKKTAMLAILQNYFSSMAMAKTDSESSSNTCESIQNENEWEDKQENLTYKTSTFTSDDNPPSRVPNYRVIRTTIPS